VGRPLLTRRFLSTLTRNYGDIAERAGRDHPWTISIHEWLD